MTQSAMGAELLKKPGDLAEALETLEEMMDLKDPVDKAIDGVQSATDSKPPPVHLPDKPTEWIKWAGTNNHKDKDVDTCIESGDSRTPDTVVHQKYVTKTPPSKD